MPRPQKYRRICALPQTEQFGPLSRTEIKKEPVEMTVDEYETIRLIDLEGYTQEECAQQMAVARTTVQAIYDSARSKLADTLVNGKELLIRGGTYKVCENAMGCEWQCQGRHGGQGKHCRNGCKGPGL